MKHILAISFLFLSLTTLSQTIENVTFQQENDDIIIYYDLLGEEGSTYDISLLYSFNGGQNFQGPCQQVSGAVGQVEPAYGHRITWRATEEIGYFTAPNFAFRVMGNYTPAPPHPDPNHSDPTLDLPADMVYVKGGTFTMGSPESEEGRGTNETQHRVTVSDFLIGKYEVTFEEYDAFCNATGKKKSDDESWGRNHRPAINVSWYDAIEYCNWRSQQEDLEPFYTINKFSKKVTVNWNSKGYRLPTEAEWEYSARGGGKAIMFGNGKNILDHSEANFDASGSYKMNASRRGTYRRKTVPVGSLNAPNVLGLHDMAGNAYEWCWDWYGTYPTSAQTDPQGPMSGGSRVLRGGSWGSYPQFCRIANRYRHTPTYRNNNIGFRLSRHY
ncbi:MAG: formylglycine-generating enzyme family protein [Bacteroidota bacterium]